MQQRHGGPTVSPMVGTYFGIFAAALAGGALLLLIFEQLGAGDATLRSAMAIISIALFAAIGASAYTSRAREFLTSGRRVPALYIGGGLAIATPGAAGLVGLSGALFLTGFDALCIGLGLIAGLAVSLLLIAPYLRKFGAPTVPGYLGLRFESGPVRLTAASLAVVPLMLLALAEIKIAIMAASWLVPMAPAAAVSLIVCVLLLTIVPGGVRSLAWSSAAQALAVLVAIILPAAITAVMETNLPFAQLSHGPLLRAVGRIEAEQVVPVPIASLLALELPGTGLQAIAGRYATVFGSIGPLAFVLLLLTVMAGTAGSPALLSRAATAPSVYETRKSIGWAVVLVGILLMTFSSIAVFERDQLLTLMAGQPAASPPPPLQRLIGSGIAAIDGAPARLAATSVLFDRDSMLLALPLVMGMPQAVVNLVAAGVLAAALAGAALSLTQIGIIVAEDVVHAPASWRVSDLARVNACRLAIIGATLLAGIGAVTARGDPLLLLLNALALAGSTLFPVLALSIWWKRMTAMGALAGLLGGFLVAIAVMLAADAVPWALPGLLAPALAIPAAVIAAAIVSQLTPPPGRHILELVRDLRIPGGETLYDREARQARARGRHTP